MVSSCQRADPAGTARRSWSASRHSARMRAGVRSSRISSMVALAPEATAELWTSSALVACSAAWARSRRAGLADVVGDLREVRVVDGREPLALLQRQQAVELREEVVGHDAQRGVDRLWVVGLTGVLGCGS